MSNFSTDTAPREIAVTFQREMIATATARYLTTEMDIEVWVSQQTVFGSVHPTGQDSTTFFIRAFCTWNEMKEAAEQAICECINHDSELVKLGLLPAWKQACQLFGVSDRTVKRRIEAGEIQSKLENLPRGGVRRLVLVEERAGHGDQSASLQTEKGALPARVGTRCQSA